jgi:sialate O-acetylesterase
MVVYGMKVDKTRLWETNGMNGQVWPASIALLVIGAESAAAEPLTLHPLFADHMVLQRGQPITVHGTGPIAATVTVRFREHVARAVVEPDGRWAAVLPPVQTSAGELTVSDSTGGALRRTDVVAGDVFLCSGQSNMDLPVSDASYPRRTAEEGEGMPVRIMKVRRTSHASPASTFEPDIAWAPAGPESLPGFSAACWHMARNLVAAGVDAPIGLVQASWGGASMQDWMPAEALAGLPAYADQIRLLAHYARDPAAAAASLTQATDVWATSVDMDSTSAARPEHDDSDWATIRVPGGWERSGISSLAGFDGVMWFRRTVMLSPEQAAQSAILRLGRIDERDHVWVNGRMVGATVAASESRAYALPPGTLVAGRNVIAVRAIDERGGGGFVGRNADVSIDLAQSPAISLAGDWLYRTGAARAEWGEAPPFVPWSAPRGLSTMWNGMIAPLQGFPLKGVAWYQGESNVSEAASYRELTGRWARSWRAFFGDPDLPIVVAQLPGYGPRSPEPSNGDWAQLRDAQRLAALDDPRMGLAVLIDLGVSYDIHPAHKEEVGARLAYEMLRVAYGRDVPAAPSPTAVDRTPDEVRIRFSDTGGGLRAHGSFGATAFELCDFEAPCRFVPAQVDGDTIVLPRASASFDVRYAWQGSPPINLYGRSGLPVVPFSLSVRPTAR